MQSALARGATMVLLLAVLPVVQPAAQDLPAGYGPRPELPPPKEGWLPTVKWSVANEPWTKGHTPKAAAGLQVVAFAQGLKHPRWLHVLPNGDVLVAEAATEPSPSWWPRIPFKDGRPAGRPLDVLTGFLKEDGSGVAHGRPVGVAVDGSGALLVADDTGNSVWRVTRDQRQSQTK